MAATGKFEFVARRRDSRRTLPPLLQSLYDQWLAIAAQQNTTTAWTDVATGDSLTFSELAQRVEKAPLQTEPLAAEARGIGFIKHVLVAWRDRQPLIPIERGAPTASPPPASIPKGTAHLKRTSGSTGQPRWIAFTEEQLAADAAQIMSTMKLDDLGANVAAISLAHSYGFSNLVLPLLLFGKPLVVADNPLPASVSRALAAAGGRPILAAVPAMWEAWQRSGILKEQPPAQAISAGAPLKGALERSIYDHSGIKVHNFYGASECGGIAFDRSPVPRPTDHQVGTAMDGVSLEIDDSGHLAVRSRAVGTGYLKEDQSDTLGDGRFLTSDLARIDCDNGEVHLLGRSDDLINVAGRKVSPDEIEAVLASLEGVEACVVFGVPAEIGARGEDIVACVNSTRPPTDLSRELQLRLENWQIPRKWWVDINLKTNERGKISRSEWRAKYLAR